MYDIAMNIFIIAVFVMGVISLIFPKKMLRAKIREKENANTRGRILGVIYIVLAIVLFFV